MQWEREHKSVYQIASLKPNFEQHTAAAVEGKALFSSPMAVPLRVVSVVLVASCQPSALSPSMLTFVSLEVGIDATAVFITTLKHIDHCYYS